MGKEAKIGVEEGNQEINCPAENTIPVNLRLCADARRGDCPYYMKIVVNTERVSFYQGFCVRNFKKN